jgi:hypothetical protein
MIVDGVLWEAAACARFAHRLEALVRSECRRDGCAVDDALGELLFEMVEAGDRYRSTHAPTSANGSNGSSPDCRPAIVATMTTSDVAVVLGITERGVRDLAARGRLSGQRAAAGASWVFDPLDVATYREERAR